jgi:hypothetical protein
VGPTTFVDPDDVRPGSRANGGRASLAVVSVYRPGAPLFVEALDPAQTLVQLLSAAANLDVIGVDGFTALTALAARIPGYRVEYGDLAEAVVAIDDLVARASDASDRR